MKTFVVALVIALVGCACVAEAASDAATDPQSREQMDQDSNDPQLDELDFSFDGDGDTDEQTESEEIDFGFAMEGPEQSSKPTDTQHEGWFSDAFFAPMRFTLRHEMSNQGKEPNGLVNNRSSFRWELSKFFWNNFFVQVDTKINVFWDNDHRARARDKDALFEGNTKEAYLQYSKGDTSVKVGIQNLIWGDSIGGAITDVVSPRNYSELLFISLEESRIGQFMINVEQFSNLGDFNFFFIPNADFNQYGEKGTEYYVNPFEGIAVFQDDPDNNNDHEFGLRWKTNFVNSDLSLLAASVIDNDYALRNDGFDANNKMLISRLKYRYELAGMSYNFANGNVLYKAEAAYKKDKAFVDSGINLLSKNVLDLSISAQYSMDDNESMSLELVNNHIFDHNDAVVGFEEDNMSLIFTWLQFFLHDDLSITYMAIYSEPYTSVQHSLITEYKWDDNLKFMVDAFYTSADDSRSGLNIYDDQNQLVLKVQYQF
jgi:hypothetical protein